VIRSTDQPSKAIVGLSQGFKGKDALKLYFSFVHASQFAYTNIQSAGIDGHQYNCFKMLTSLAGAK